MPEHLRTLRQLSTSQTRKLWKSITAPQHLFFLSLSSNEKKSESIYFVLFGSRGFSVRWQGLRIMKYIMDSNRQIINLFERHTYKYVRKS